MSITIIKRSLLVCAVFIFIIAQGAPVRAADSICAKVELEIAQELTMERVAFDAKLVLTNNLPYKDLQNIRVDLHLNNKDGVEENARFFVKLVSAENLTDGTVDGTGTVKAGARAELHWLIIPSPGAGGEDPAGIKYWVGATLSYTIEGEEDIIPIYPDVITVRPTAQLVLDYFMPYSVLGDNPFTMSVVEPPRPYELAVRVSNDGFGSAWKLKIDSAQPKITENDQGLLIDFQLLGASVNDSPVNTSLIVDMGDVASKDISTAYWEMVSTLSGRFEEFDVSFTHSDDLGGELTSLIRETNAHYLIHRVKVNLPGRDDRLDFLADTDRDEEHLPDTIFESEYRPDGSDEMADAEAVVTVVTQSALPPRPVKGASSVDVTLDLTPEFSVGPLGWIYTKMADPSQGMLELMDVVRADGVHLDPNNFWVDEGLNEDYQTIHTLQFVDYRNSLAAPETYTLVFKEPEEDTVAPTTTIVYDGPDFTDTATGTVYITPETTMFPTAQDNDGGSGVAAIYKDFNTPFYPFKFTTVGAYTLEYYSVDWKGNTEETKNVNIFVDNAAPEIVTFEATSATVTSSAPTGIVVEDTTSFTVNVIDDVTTMSVTIKVLNADGNTVRTITGIAESGVDTTFEWDGKDDSGVSVPTGDYGVELSVSDGLDDIFNAGATPHTSTSDPLGVRVTEWFVDEPLAPATEENPLLPLSDQMYPDVSGTKVVWQDKRSGDWDIYVKDIETGVVTRLTSNASDETRPSIDGDIVVWQEDVSGTFGMYGYDLLNNKPISIVSCILGDQVNPDVSGNWVVWQDNKDGNWDIYAKNISTRDPATSEPAIRVTSHERDQINPIIVGNTIVWEDYRNGLGEIYKYDLTTNTETRVTIDAEGQTIPALSDTTLVWTDERDGQKNIYRNHLTRGNLRVSYGDGNYTQGAIFGTTLVYVDYEAGTNDPNLSFQELISGVGGRLTTHPAKQEEPAVGDGIVVWQDDRDGVYQIYTSEFKVELSALGVYIRPGHNLIAVGEMIAGEYVTVQGLIAATQDNVVINRVLAYEKLHNTYTEVLPGGEENVTLVQGMALEVYAENSGWLEVAESDEKSSYTLIVGMNHIGILSLPHGYSAYDLMNSVGLNSIISVERFDNKTGLWHMAYTEVSGGDILLSGANFTIQPGDGLRISMKKRVDNWLP